MIARRTLLGALAGGAAVRPGRAAGTKVTLAVSSNSLAYGGLNIARRAGLFEQHGIDPTVSVMDSGSAAMAAVLSGSIEFCSASLGEALAARVRGQAIVVVANMYRGLSGSLVLATPVVARLGLQPDAPLEARLKALEGLTIATPSATSSYTFPFRIVGQGVGVQPRFVYMGQPAMLAALQAGAIQGMIAGAPFSTLAISTGAGTMWVNGPAGELPADALPASSACIETSADYAKARPEVIAGIRATFEALGRFIRDKPGDARAMLAGAYPQLDAPVIAEIFRNDGPNWTRPAMSLDDIRHEIALQQRAGVLKNVDAVDPASVLAG